MGWEGESAPSDTNEERLSIDDIILHNDYNPFNPELSIIRENDIAVIKVRNGMKGRIGVTAKHI